MKLGKWHFNNLRSPSYSWPDKAMVNISAKEIVSAMGDMGRESMISTYEGCGHLSVFLSIAVKEITSQFTILKKKWCCQIFCGPEFRKSSKGSSLQSHMLLQSDIGWGSGHLNAFSSVQFNAVAQSCLTLCDPIDCSMPGFPVHQQLSEFIQTHVHWVGDAIQPSHPLSSPSPPAFNLSQHQGLFHWVGSSHQVAQVLEFQLQHQSFQWIFRTDFL